MKNHWVKISILSLILGLIIGVSASFIGYKLIISPRNARQAEQQQRRYESMLDAQRAEDQRLLNQRAQQLPKSTTDFSKTVLSDNPDDHALALLDMVNETKYIGTLLVVKNGRVIVNQGIGYANAADGQKNGPTTLYQIGSVQKSITAVIVMQLIQAGKLKLSDPISKFYRGIKGGDAITIRRLLDMHSGLRLTATQDKVLSDKAIVQFAIQHLSYTHRQTQDYQPVNYVLLAGVIEKLTGNLYATEVQKRIVRPLKLIHTGFMPGLLQEENHALAYSGSLDDPYTKVVNWTEVMWNRELGTGNIYATAGDLFHIEQAITTGKLLTPENVAILRDSNNGLYGGGVYNYDDYFVTHGVLGGHEATVVMSHDGKNAVVLMGNHFSNQIQSKPLATNLYHLVVNNN